jgi:hypothetical protein
MNYSIKTNKQKPLKSALKIHTTGYSYTFHSAKRVWSDLGDPLPSGTQARKETVCTQITVRQWTGAMLVV